MQIDSSLLAPVSPYDSLVHPKAAAANSSSNSTSTTDPAANSGLGTTDALANENTFLQLLVTQIKNQDPTQPMDSTTFLTQLAQFSSLEQLIGIRQDVQTLDSGVTAATTSTPAA
jgi:flagellar basal-body rod modification protein FlgD